ncbi:hypothetical protein KR038_007902, partial [Drosophila bunnanda]
VAWRGVRLKKRHPGDKDDHSLKAGEVEKDLGLELNVDADQELTLDESEEEEDGDLTIVVNSSSGIEPGTHVPQDAAAQSP